MAGLIDQYKLTFLLATPTFLRGYLRKAEPEQLGLCASSLPARKIAARFGEPFSRTFRQRGVRRYGLTETAPVVSVNLPKPEPRKPGEHVQPSSRSGSVGRWPRASRRKFANRRPTKRFRCTTAECFGCVALIFSRDISTIRNGPPKSCTADGSRPATSAVSMKMDSFTLKADSRDFQRSVAKWFHTK